MIRASSGWAGADIRMSFRLRMSGRAACGIWQTQDRAELRVRVCVRWSCECVESRASAPYEGERVRLSNGHEGNLNGQSAEVEKGRSRQPVSMSQSRKSVRGA